MMRRLIVVCSLFVLGLLGNVHAEAKPPRVLILTDQVLTESARMVATEFKGRADVVVSSPAMADTGRALARLDELLGDGPWSLIQFNFGLADLRLVVPGRKSVRLMSRHHGGVLTTSPEQYEANLEKIVARLKQTKAKPIWASTTPIVGDKYDHIFITGSEIAYNEIAAKIMNKEKIPVNDLHAWVKENVKKFSNPVSFKRIPIHEPTVVGIEKALGLPPKPKKPAKTNKK